MKNVCCVGIAVADVVVKPIVKIPDPGKLELVNSITMHTGGCAVNAAIDLKKLGIDISICSLIGDDVFGNFVQDSLFAQGVDITGLKRTSKLATSSSVVLGLESGERSFLHNIGANGLFGLDDIDWDVIEASDLVFVAGALVMTTFDGEQTKLFLKKAKELGKTTVLDTVWDSTGAWMDKIECCLPYVDYFMPSIEEAKMMSQYTTLKEIAEDFIDKGAKYIIIKCGEDGCYANYQEKEYYCSAYNVDVVDTNGAGDSFVAGFMAALVEDLVIDQALEFACAVGGYCVGKLGASTGIVHKDKVYKFLKEQKIKKMEENK